MGEEGGREGIIMTFFMPGRPECQGESARKTERKKGDEMSKFSPPPPHLPPTPSFLSSSLSKSFMTHTNLLGARRRKFDTFSTDRLPQKWKTSGRQVKKGYGFFSCEATGLYMLLEL